MPDPQARLMEEVSAMRSLLEGQLAQLTWSDGMRRAPLRSRLARDLLSAGYSAAMAREITQRLPDDFSEAQAGQWLAGVLARNLVCTAPGEDIVTRGGIYALVGPTGVGKTTTTAKLAARCAVRHGAGSIALLTTDSFRVAAHDQLRVFARILGVTVHTVASGADLDAALAALADRHLVLIDTVGMGQRDARVAEQAQLLARPDVQRILLLNATAQAETLDEVVASYGATACGGAPLAGCIISKLDEAVRPGQVLDVAIRHRLPLHFVANGQRVPEDLHEPNAGYLVHRSLKTAPQAHSPFTLRDDEFALVAGASHA
jgi:flagellar biosynthesis protein FlhF